MYHYPNLKPTCSQQWTIPTQVAKSTPIKHRSDYITLQNSESTPTFCLRFSIFRFLTITLFTITLLRASPKCCSSALCIHNGQEKALISRTCHRVCPSPRLFYAQESKPRQLCCILPSIVRNNSDQRPSRSSVDQALDATKRPQCCCALRLKKKQMAVAEVAEEVAPRQGNGCESTNSFSRFWILVRIWSPSRVS